MPRQKDLARAADMHQSRISMFETPGMANVTLETLARLAATFKTGIVVKFVPFHEMLHWENSFSQDAFDVIPRLDSDDKFINPAMIHNSNLAAMGATAGASGVGHSPKKPSANVQDFRPGRVMRLASFWPSSNSSLGGSQ
jgi:transcriptional regulator with XRE-family HTH domain